MLESKQVTGPLVVVRQNQKDELGRDRSMLMSNQRKVVGELLVENWASLFGVVQIARQHETLIHLVPILASPRIARLKREPTVESFFSCSLEDAEITCESSMADQSAGDSSLDCT